MTLSPKPPMKVSAKAVPVIIWSDTADRSIRATTVQICCTPPVELPDIAVVLQPLNHVHSAWGWWLVARKIEIWRICRCSHHH